MWQFNLSTKPLNITSQISQQKRVPTENDKSLNNKTVPNKYRGKTTNLSTIKVSQTNIKENWQSSQRKKTKLSTINIREGFKKSKWKFKMAFAMKGGGSRGGLECHLPILKNDFFKKPFRIIPWLWKRVLHLVWALYYVYRVDEMTLNMAK